MVIFRLVVAPDVKRSFTIDNTLMLCYPLSKVKNKMKKCKTENTPNETAKDINI